MARCSLHGGKISACSAGSYTSFGNTSRGTSSCKQSSPWRRCERTSERHATRRTPAWDAHMEIGNASQWRVRAQGDRTLPGSTRTRKRRGLAGPPATRRRIGPDIAAVDDSSAIWRPCLLQQCSWRCWNLSLRSADVLWQPASWERAFRSSSSILCHCS